MRKGIGGIGEVAGNIGPLRERLQRRPYDPIRPVYAGNGVALAASVGCYGGSSAAGGTDGAGGRYGCFFTAGDQSGG